MQRPITQSGELAYRSNKNNQRKCFTNGGYGAGLVFLLATLTVH